ncbi:CACTA en-spm transposon protein [Cucumis melo var. makuwa]|uniref:CACTA en-spm transposon protein n=1 Tax=Cucumis melo var. makuwa TaxID=1194695 RepID=A0A5D3BV18_CUCMM|nr:CACTA en-spm transposon protein [Cucumis melo var. makuwa]TYK01939.1 CACTA en-spm transposon protein [Cucumis melo var. makuwa]
MKKDSPSCPSPAIALIVVVCCHRLSLYIEDGCHQWATMLSTFKEFRASYHINFKKYSNPKEARANPPNISVERDED